MIETREKQVCFEEEIRVHVDLGGMVVGRRRGAHARK